MPQFTVGVCNFRKGPKVRPHERRPQSRCLENTVASESELQRCLSLPDLSDFDGGLQSIHFIQRGESGRGISRVTGRRAQYTTLGHYTTSPPAAQQGVVLHGHFWRLKMRTLNIHAVLLILTLMAAAGCQSSQKPGLALKEARLAEGPVIIQRGNHFYLRYRRALEDDRFQLRVLVYVRKTKEAGYYFFS